jgi:hypothetical protein
VCHHRCGGILDDGLAFVVKYGQLSTVAPVLAPAPISHKVKKCIKGFNFSLFTPKYS